MVHYELIKVTIDALGLAKMIINMIVRHHGVSKSIVINQGLLFISKFWSLLYYFLEIKKKLFIAFYLQIDGQIERQNSIIEVNLRVFINWE